jgi:hypothetical protein
MIDYDHLFLSFFASVAGCVFKFDPDVLLLLPVAFFPPMWRLAEGATGDGRWWAKNKAFLLRKSDITVSSTRHHQ